MKTHPDAQIILRYGGATALARMLGLSSPQRVQNWLVRGIPSRVKLEYPDLFLKTGETNAAIAPAAIKKEAPHG